MGSANYLTRFLKCGKSPKCPAYKAPNAVWRRKFELDFDHLKVFLARAALGTRPVHRHILPARAGRDPLLWEPRSLVVNKPANKAHPGLGRLRSFCHWNRGLRAAGPGLKCAASYRAGTRVTRGEKRPAVRPRFSPGLGKCTR